MPETEEEAKKEVNNETDIAQNQHEGQGWTLHQPLSDKSDKLR